MAVCESPTSDAVTVAVGRAFTDAEKGGFGAVPVALRDTHYAGAARIGSGEGYLYPHDFPGHWVRQNYMPEGLQGHVYYEPTDMGMEAGIRERKAKRDGKEQYACG